MNKEDVYYLGYVSGKHGIGNSLTIKLDVDNANDYSNLDGVFVELSNSLMPLFVSNSKPHKSKELIIEIEDVSDVRIFVGCSVYLPLEQLPKLEGKKFYFHEIIGYKAIDLRAGAIGIIEDVLDYPHQQIFSIKFNAKEILIPIIDDFIVEVNKQEKKIILNAPDGLIDIYLTKNNPEEE